MNVRAMNHFTILAEDLEKTRNFYSTVLGLKEGYRPPLEFPGAWFYVGDQALLHVIARRPLPEPRGGVLDHMAFTAKDLKRTLGELKKHGLEDELVHQSGREVWHVFFYAPNDPTTEPHC